jgi:Apc13p protein
MSDSSYIAVTRHRRPFSTAGRPPALELVDDDFAADKLSDDEIDTSRHEVPLMDDGEMDASAAVVSTGTSVTATNKATERRRREQGWNDLGLDQLDDRHVTTQPRTTSAPTSNIQATAAQN